MVCKRKPMPESYRQPIGMAHRSCTQFVLSLLVCSIVQSVVSAQPTDWTDAADNEVKKNSTSDGVLLWSDEFASPTPNTSTFPNPDIWDRDLGMGEWGWGNNEYQNYTDALDNAFVRDGALHIVARRRPATASKPITFTSARLKTDGKMLVQYGTIVARIQIPNVADGLWAGFWTLGQNFKEVGWPKAGEIDIMEIGDAYSLDNGNGNKRVISAIHMEKADGKHFSNYTWTEPRPVDLNLTYHMYKLEWTPTSISMFVDDYRTHYINIDLNVCLGCEELHQPHYLIFNLAVGGNFNLRPTDVQGPERITAPFPATMKVDYVRIYDNGFSNVFIPTPAPTTLAPTTLAPTTSAPTTLAPSTSAPTTAFPTISPTPAPTKRPTTKTPTKHPTTKSPTKSPTTKAPTWPTWRTPSSPSVPPTQPPVTSDNDFSSIVDSASSMVDTSIWIGLPFMYLLFQSLS